MEQSPLGVYAVTLHKQVEKFLRKHPDLREKWSDIEKTLVYRPLVGPQITHLKGELFCSRRWRVDPYRVLYDVDEDGHVVFVFRADTRGDIY